MSLREELVQVAAVAVAWIENLDGAPPPISIQKVLHDIKQERYRQDIKWGSQRDLHDFAWLAILTEEVGEAAQAAVDDPSNWKGDTNQ